MSQDENKTLHQRIADILGQATGKDAEVTVPTHAEQGHYSTNLALQNANGNPRDLAEEYVEKVKAGAPEDFFERVEVAGPGFINFFISKETLRKEFLQADGSVRSLNRLAGDRAGQTVIVEYLSPNIAKPLHVGHLRNIIIGSAIANLHEAQGYDVIRWNYIGDWGRQFGVLLAAYKKWGGEELFGQERPLEELEKLYVRFNKELKENPELEDLVQSEIEAIEEEGSESRRLWEKIREISLKESDEFSGLLNVSFDIYQGESYFAPMTEEVIKELKDQGLVEESEGALVVPLEEYGLPTALVQKSDGKSLYLTRDLAALKYRVQKYKPKKLLYVIGNEQSLQFEQLFAIVKKLGWAEGVELVHVKYGLLLGQDGKKMSTRKGTTVHMRTLVEDIVDQAVGVVKQKNPDLDLRQQAAVARAVGIGALKYNDLHERRTTDITFDRDRMLDFSGDSAPYLQYTYARLKSILRKVSWWQGAFSMFSNKEGVLQELGDEGYEIMRQIIRFPEIVEKSTETLLPNLLAGYLHQLAVATNKFYETTRILDDDNKKRKAAHIELIKQLANTLAAGLAQLGIETPEEI